MGLVVYGQYKDTATINRYPKSELVSYPQGEFFGKIRFTNVNWEFDRSHNYAPLLRMEGYVESIENISDSEDPNNKLPCDIEKIYFDMSKPPVTYYYHFDDPQMKTLAEKGLWGENGVELPDLFTSSNFLIELNAVVTEAKSVRERTGIPAVMVEIVNQYDNHFDSRAYVLADRIKTKIPEESKKFEQQINYNIDKEMYIQDEIEKRKEEERKRFEEAAKAAYRPLTPEEIQNQKMSENAGNEADKFREIAYGERDAHNEAYEAERKQNEEAAAIAAELTEKQERDKQMRDAMDKLSTDIKQHEDIDTSGVADPEHNVDIFANTSEESGVEFTDEQNEFFKSLGADSLVSETAEPVSEVKVAEKAAEEAVTEQLDEDTELKMEQFGDDKTETEKTSTDDKTTDSNSGSDSDNKNDTGSGAASGANVLKVYTTEYDANLDKGKSDPNYDRKLREAKLNADSKSANDDISDNKSDEISK